MSPQDFPETEHRKREKKNYLDSPRAKYSISIIRSFHDNSSIAPNYDCHIRGGRRGSGESEKFVMLPPPQSENGGNCMLGGGRDAFSDPYFKKSSRDENCSIPSPRPTQFLPPHNPSTTRQDGDLRNEKKNRLFRKEFSSTSPETLSPPNAANVVEKKPWSKLTADRPALVSCFNRKKSKRP